MATPSPYIALALQTTCFAINDADDAAASRPRMLAAIAVVERLWRVMRSSPWCGGHSTT